MYFYSDATNSTDAYFEMFALVLQYSHITSSLIIQIYLKRMSYTYVCMSKNILYTRIVYKFTYLYSIAQLILQYTIHWEVCTTGSLYYSAETL